MEDYEMLNSHGYLLNKENWYVHTYFSQEIRKLGYKVTPEHIQYVLSKFINS